MMRPPPLLGQRSVSPFKSGPVRRASPVPQMLPAECVAAAGPRLHQMWRTTLLPPSQLLSRPPLLLRCQRGVSAEKQLRLLRLLLPLQQMLRLFLMAMYRAFLDPTMHTSLRPRVSAV